MKWLFTVCLSLAAPQWAAAQEASFKLLFTEDLAPLAQALAQPQIQLQANPQLKDVLQPRIFVLSKGGLTDQGISQLGASAKQLIRLTVAAQSSASTVEDAFNGQDKDSTVYYIYTVASNEPGEFQALQNAVSGWYSAESIDKIRAAGYTPPPQALLTQNKVSLKLVEPQFPNGYR